VGKGERWVRWLVLQGFAAAVALFSPAKIWVVEKIFGVIKWLNAGGAISKMNNSP